MSNTGYVSKSQVTYNIVNGKIVFSKEGAHFAINTGQLHDLKEIIPQAERDLAKSLEKK